jgi:diguanylate cyclase (GGDEF)-like protein
LNKPNFQQRAQQLREKFLSQIPQRLQRAEEELARLQRDEMDLGQGLSELRTLFHNIKGTSSTYGLSEVAQLAERAETAFAEALHRNDGQTPANLLTTIGEGWGLIAQLRELSGQDQGGVQLPTGFDLSQCVTPDCHCATGPNTQIIYLCDDDADLRQQLINQLGCFGYQVRGFANGVDLMAAVAEQAPHVVIMDIILAEGEDAGLQLAKRLREEARLPLPIIFISGRGDFNARLDAVRAGGVAYCTKPVPPIELVDILDAMSAHADQDPYRILVVDDDPNLASYTALVLREAGMTVEIITDPKAVLAALPSFNADLVLMDLYMHDCVGIELARILRQIPGYLSLPIVYLSAETSMEEQFNALSVGADGFLTKPIKPQQLITAVSLRAERMRNLRNLMVRDSLTGLFNHTNIKQMLEHECVQAERQGWPVCFAMLDLDRFKEINDNFGHGVGDQVLIAIARLLRQRLRKSDIIGRYGGEEFAVILPNTELGQATEVMNALRASFATIEFFTQGQVFHASYSCGIASSLQYANPSDLRSAADRALYEAKQKGRNRIQVDQTPESRPHV